MDQETLTLLEFPQLLQIVESFAQSPMGKNEVRGIRPGIAPELLRPRMARVAEAIRFTSSGTRLDFRELEDPDEILARLPVAGEILEPKELLLLLELLKRMDEVRALLTPEPWPELSQMIGGCPSLQSQIREIDRVIDPAGEVRESADPELAAARRRQSRYREQVQEQLRGYFSGNRAKFLVQDPYVTLRNGRYVIPVKLEHQKDLPGVVHGSSSSGATLFVEPFPVVELNNQYLHFQDREKEILYRILRRLADRLRPDVPVFRTVRRAIGELDAVFACADFAARYRCRVPDLADPEKLSLHGARHPLLIHRLGYDQVTPISARLDRDKSVLIISGPNAGGKTAALKTVGLLSLMASAALPVPAEDAELPVFKSILADIGDHQSLEQQLSTFSAHVLRLKRIMELLELPALVLLDEVGAGTDPAHGAVLGISVVDVFRRRKALVVATTHHSAIKQFGSATPGVQNASVELDEKTLMPTYQLRMGVAGGSSGLQIASMLGLPDEVVEQARTLLTDQDLQAEEYLAELRRELNQLEQARRDLNQEIEHVREKELEVRREYERREQERQRAAELALSRWTEEFQQESERFVKSVKDRFEAARIRKEMKQRQAVLKEAFRRRMANESRPASGNETETREVSKDELRPGQLVLHSFFRKRGKLISVSGETAVVEIEGKRVAASLDQLRRTQEPEVEKAPTRPLPPNVRLEVTEEAEYELNVIGQTVEDALAQVDKFLDRAFVASLMQVRIVHGFGKGKLKSALAGFLVSHPHVLNHQVEGGATVISIRH
jgi:DNA mismatch repair protein MutS2